MSTHTIAVVGYGSIGRRHSKMLHEMGYGDIIVVEPEGPCYTEESFPVVQRMQELGHWRITHGIICCPPNLHHGYARYFLDRTWPVLIEKPMAVSCDQADDLLRTANSRGAHIGIGYMERANPTVLAAKKFAQENTVKNAYIELYWNMEPKTYHQDFLLESSHAIDTARFILGDVKVVGSTIKEKSAEITLAHAGGYTFVTIDADANPMRRINLYAHNGQSFGKQYGYNDEEWNYCYKTELQAFLDGTPLCTGADGLAVMEILDEVKR